MAEITHAVATDQATRSTTSSDFVDVNAAATIAAASQDADSDYFLFVRMQIGANTSSGNNAEYRVDNGSVLLHSEARIEPRRSAIPTGHPYFYIKRLTTANPTTDMDCQFRYGGGAQTVRVQNQQMMMIKLDDLAAADFAYDEDLTALTALDDTAWTDGASVAIGDGSSNFEVYYYCHMIVDAVGDSIRLRLNVGGTTFDIIQLEGEDTVEEYCIGGIAYLAAPASSTTVKIQMQTDSATAGLMDVECSRVFALRLNAFEDHFGERDTADISVTAADTETIVGNVLHTVDTAASRNWAIHGFTINDVSESVKRTHYRLVEDAAGNLVGDTVDHMVQHGDADQVPLLLFAEMTAVADATALDIDYTVQEEADIVPSPVFIDTHFVGFTWELASAGRTVAATTQALVITAQAASINRQRGIDSILQALALSEQAATVNRKRNVEGTVQALAISEAAAALNRARGVAAAVQALTITEQTASIGVTARTVLALVQALTITAQVATINAKRQAAATLQALSFVEFAATIAKTPAWSEVGDASASWGAVADASASWSSLANADTTWSPVTDASDVWSEVSDAPATTWTPT